MRLEIADIDRAEVLRYLGYAGQELQADLVARIDGVLERCRAVCQPAGTWADFPVEAVRTRADGTPEVALAGTALAPAGHDVCAHLRGARSVGVLAVTLGVASERELRRLSSADPLEAVIFDAACSALVEQAADAAEAQLAQAAQAKGLMLGARFSPGYGDWGLDAQPQMLAAVDAQRRLGLTLTPTLLLVPTKSVTAVVGMFDTSQLTRTSAQADPCESCFGRTSCAIRKTGRTCRG